MKAKQNIVQPRSKCNTRLSMHGSSELLSGSWYIIIVLDLWYRIWRCLRVVPTLSTRYEMISCTIIYKGWTVRRLSLSYYFMNNSYCLTVWHIESILCYAQLYIVSFLVNCNLCIQIFISVRERVVSLQHSIIHRPTIQCPALWFANRIFTFSSISMLSKSINVWLPVILIGSELL